MILSSIEKYVGNWHKRNWLIFVIYSVLALLGIFIMIQVLDLNSMFWLAFIPIAVVLGWRMFKYNASEDEAIHYLHGTHPELEYSLRLANQESGNLNILQAFQQDKVKAMIGKMNVVLPPFRKMLIEFSGIVLISIVMVGLLGLVKTDPIPNNPLIDDLDLESGEVSENQDSAFIDQLRMTIAPPEYTGGKTYAVEAIEKELPEGSWINWNFRKNGPADVVRFHFDKLPGQESSKKQFFKSSIYYYSVKDTAEVQINSPYYSIKIKEDQKPNVTISGIEEYQRIPWKKNYDIDFSIAVSDDYGVEDAFISATVANGQGESVIFREKTFPLKNFAHSKFSFSTAELEMEPGSELYFYVMAKDICPYRIQATKSTTYFVILEDTVTYDYADDSGMQVDLMPDFFRSQRQIIIDSEKLIAEKSSISELEFKQRSNELGFDQKMLRLKYGQFLGEEAESGIAIENEIEEDHDHEEDHEEGDEGINVLEEYGHNHDHEAEENMLLETSGTIPEDPSRPEWVQAMSHNHDNAEENTYFEVSLKTKLKAALSVMWDSELHLRLYDPPASLPFQYEALKYLEEIKNHARIYVHRIGFDPPAIKVAEKRLTGKQEKIITPTDELIREYKIDFPSITEAVNHFSSLSAGPNHFLNDIDKELLQSAGNELAGVALEQATLLPSLTLIRRLINSGLDFSEKDKKLLIAGLLSALPKQSKDIFHEEIRIHPVNKAALEAI